MPVRSNYRAPEITYHFCLFGFDKLGPYSIPYLQIHYWGGIEEALQKLSAKVVVTKVPRVDLDCRYLITHLPTKKSIVRTLTTIATPHHGSPFMDWCRDNIGVGEISQTFEEAAKVVDGALKQMAEKTRGHQNLNDSRSSLLESRVQEQSLRSPSQAENIVNQKEQLRSTIVATKTDQSEPSKASNKKSFNMPISFNLPNFHLPNFNLSLPNINSSNISLSAFDTPAYSNLTTDYCVNYFIKSIPNNPSVAYYSYGASTNVLIWSPLYFPYQIIKEKEGPNDGLVSIKSAQWGKYMGTVECDHWDLTNRWRLKIGSSLDPVEFYLNVATFLATEGY
ncbi:hypothetical protein C2G38_2243040 [Gigaspora rosea]|uniref:Alpha/Beta hydrolase protein n=1 Tax=Gigaspora rosea TaxID=44941 RepID=A0A397VNJ1_9GLOM|nr:hypothetical protein C2G38_2243040 [Gigaspora rosea]